MSDKYFLDTNIFVYCFDRKTGKKQPQAEALVEKALKDHAGMISSQVIQEFLNVATRKFSPPLTPSECQAYLEIVLIPLCDIFPSVTLYQEAISLKAETGFSFYDSLMVAAALEGGCSRLYSEDLQSGQMVRGMKIINPFI